MRLWGRPGASLVRARRPSPTPPARSPLAALAPGGVSSRSHPILASRLMPSLHPPGGARRPAPRRAAAATEPAPRSTRRDHVVVCSRGTHRYQPAAWTWRLWWQAAAAAAPAAAARACGTSCAHHRCRRRRCSRPLRCCHALTTFLQRTPPRPQRQCPTSAAARHAAAEQQQQQQQQPALQCARTHPCCRPSCCSSCCAACGWRCACWPSRCAWRRCDACQHQQLLPPQRHALTRAPPAPCHPRPLPSDLSPFAPSPSPPQPHPHPSPSPHPPAPLTLSH